MKHYCFVSQEIIKHAHGTNMNIQKNSEFFENILPFFLVTVHPGAKTLTSKKRCGDI